MSTRYNCITCYNINNNNIMVDFNINIISTCRVKVIPGKDSTTGRHDFLADHIGR